MRYLLAPCNNTLSHIAKCLALREVLEERGHEVWLTTTPERVAFLDRLRQSRRLLPLPDIQQSNNGVAPSFAWFRPNQVQKIVAEEVAALQQLRPDRVLGVFRFTTPLAARIAGIPYDSLICGSMTPACQEIPGFGPDDDGMQEQAKAMRFFRHACARRMAPAMQSLGLSPVDDLWDLLEGERTLLWDYPEFQPLPMRPGYMHVGPPLWTGWPQVDNARLSALRGRLAFVSFGTGCVSTRLLQHLINVLWHLGYAVALALGGQNTQAFRDIPGKLAVFDFLPAKQILEQADILVCHGGQLLIFEALLHRRPVFVLPLQPEQAQNGRCLERLGCGCRLISGHVFTGADSPSETDFLARPLRELANVVAEYLARQSLCASLSDAAMHISSLGGVNALANAMEEMA